MYSLTANAFAIKATVLLCIGHHVCEGFITTTSTTIIGTPLTHSQQIKNEAISQGMCQCENFFSASITASTTTTTTTLRSSFYDDFEDFDMNKDGEDDDEEDDDDDDEYAEIDQRSIADFKSKMSNLFDDSSGDEDKSMGEGMGTIDELIEYARKQQQAEESPTVADTDVAPEDWAKETSEIRPGTVLVANPSKFCDEGDYGRMSGNDNEPSGGGKDFFAAALGRTGPAPSLLAKFGLTQPPPRHLGADRQADLLPVVIVVGTEGGQVQGVLLNRRTGYLLGDLEQPSADGSSGENNEDMAPILEKFCIQPLWFGGIDSLSVGLDMLHLCPTVRDATKITEDNVYWGGDPAQAQDAMEDPSLDRMYSGFDFKFFVQSTIWSNVGTLQSEVDDKIWFPAKVSQKILFKSRDRMGTKKAKPLWAEIMGLMGDKYSVVMENFYANE
mmetsp:Transcript_315/g.576  ORF Transcript_315/g.576 Transcript_315/m.576 type:complete len:443 (-) Transcript_315:1385-2713(-)